MTQRTNFALEFDSEDDEGSDLSYESSFDEQLEQEYDQVLNQKRIVQFKDQMERVFQLNPEINGNIKLEKANFEDEEELRKLFPPKYPEPVGHKKSAHAVQISPRPSSQPPPQVHPQWGQFSKVLLNNSKKAGTVPSLEEYQQRLNLFRNNNSKGDIVDLIIQEQDRLTKDIELQEKRTKAIENAVHESIEAKVRKETGDVGYVSFRKKIQFQFRIRKAEELAQEKVEKQEKKKQSDMLKSRKIFEQLFKDKAYDDEGEFRSQAAEDLYKKIKKCQDDIEIKQTILKYIIDHRKKQNEEYQGKTSLLKPTKFISEDNKEFSLLQPNGKFKQQMSQNEITKEMLDRRDNMEDENIYLITKINQILDGNLMKIWRSQIGLKI